VQIIGKHLTRREIQKTPPQVRSAADDEKIVAALRAKIEIGAKVLGEEAREWLKLKPKR
jgi:hypothetical protein